MLKGLQQKAPVTLNVGDLPEPEGDAVDSVDDGREPVELLARILAHIAHRIPGLRKMEKRLEGNDARSGILSDVVALIVSLITRNQEVAMTVADGLVKDALNKKPATQQATKVPAHWPEQD